MYPVYTFDVNVSSLYHHSIDHELLPCQQQHHTSHHLILSILCSSSGSPDVAPRGAAPGEMHRSQSVPHAGS